MMDLSHMVKENPEMSEPTRLQKIKESARKHPLLMSLAAAVLFGFLLAVPGTVLFIVDYGNLLTNLLSLGIVGIAIGIFLGYPLLLTGIEVHLLAATVSKRRNPPPRGRRFDLVTLILGVLYSPLYLGVTHNVSFKSDWTVTLANAQTHTPVYTQDVLTVVVISLVGLAGYLIVSFLPLAKTPPLVLVLGIAAMYLGTIESILWGVHVCKEFFFDCLLLLLPFNCLLITARTVLYKIREWEAIPHERYKIDRVPLLNWCSRVLENARLWPVVAFLLMWPLFGILIAILVLFGQAPDSFIRAWTETSDWNLSQRVAPQNIYYDEHYLCTVAAGGHQKIVKPLRLGIRHGHQVIVNRQLCIANAFEQVLEERTPRFHRAVRGFYDKYGFPVARLIRSRYAADLIYFMMKPLEWFFLAVLYLTDVHPEDRIAVQYMGDRVPSASVPYSPSRPRSSMRSNPT